MDTKLQTKILCNLSTQNYKQNFYTTYVHKLQTKFLCYFSTQKLQTLTKHNQEVELLEYTICSYY
jgi:hypothetical protein